MNDLISLISIKIQGKLILYWPLSHFFSPPKEVEKSAPFQAFLYSKEMKTDIFPCQESRRNRDCILLALLFSLLQIPVGEQWVTSSNENSRGKNSTAG